MTHAIWDGKTANKPASGFDCYIAEALLRVGRSVGTKEETLLRYKVESVDELAKAQQKLLNENKKLLSLFEDVEMPLSKTLWDMEQKGIILDSKKLISVGEKIDVAIKEIEKVIIKETGDGVNLNSPTQLGVFLADKMGVALGKTKTGKYATNEAELSKFAKDFPIVANILKFRELTKLRSTYIESLIEKVGEDGRVHTTYAQVAAATGRLGSSNPNLQNIPVTSEFGLKIKSCFLAASGHTLVSFDYSQQELRVLAHLTGEEALIEAFSSNKDVHILTASKLFDTPYEQVSTQQRAVGKTINFGIIYGMSSFGLSASMNIPVDHADKFIKEFYISYPRIKTYFDAYIKQASIDGFAETLLGRRRYVFEDPKRKVVDNFMKRVLLNYPIQGTAADLMKKAMVDIDTKILSKHPEVSLLLQIHDDLVFEIPDKQIHKQSEVLTLIQEVMCAVWPLSVPLVVEIKIGKEWGDLEKMSI